VKHEVYRYTICALQNGWFLSMLVAGATTSLLPCLSDISTCVQELQILWPSSLLQCGDQTLSGSCVIGHVPYELTFKAGLC
jgi:hypothetical protein